jgi:pimeloyl-ACP methyl ester carboxylesterase
MPYVERPDGVRIHWESKGKGPVVSLSVHSYAQPEVFDGLLADLARDHTVVTYDSRGAGLSSRRGPYDAGTDAADYAAVLEAVGGGPGVGIGSGEGSHPVIIAASERPGLLRTVVAIGGGGGLVVADDAAGTESLASSKAVRHAIVEMMRNDYRSALRHLVSATNTELNDEEIRERVDRAVAYREQESATARMEVWMERAALGNLPEELGNRLWFLQWPTEWFNQETLDRLRTRLPRARIEVVDSGQGPVSRPDIAAALVREATAPLR